MAKPYENEFKLMITELVLSGKKVSELSKAYSINERIIRRWKREYESKGGGFSKKKELTIEQQEIKELKKQLKEAELERDILKKAVSIFSKVGR